MKSYLILLLLASLATLTCAKQTISWWFDVGENSATDTANANAIAQHPKSFSRVMPYNSQIKLDGNVSRWWGQDQSVQQWNDPLQKLHVPVLPYVIDIDNATMMHLVYKNSTKFIADAVNIALHYNFSGWFIDYEDEYPPDMSANKSQRLANFLTQFGDALHQNGMKLLICVASWSNLLSDYKTLANSSVDELQLMSTYENPANSKELIHSYYSQIQAGNGGLEKAGVGIGVYYDGRNGYPKAWNESSARSFIQNNVVEQGGTNLDIFRLLKDGNDDWPHEDWWWGVLDDFSDGTHLLPLTDVFESWRVQHNKHYATSVERSLRCSIFNENVAFIDRYNADPTTTMVLGVNEFTDLTHAEFLAGGWTGSSPTSPTSPTSPITTAITPMDTADTFEFADIHVPTSVDWNAKGAVTLVKNQGTCGSCWTFSATGAIEGLHFIKTGKLVSLSEQEIGECDTKRPDESMCEGGLPDEAFAWVASHENGLTTESLYPYTCLKSPMNCYNPNVTTCKDAMKVATINGHRDVPTNNETALAMAVTMQPISVGVDATAKTWQHYKSGVYDDSKCGNQIDHAVLVVGFGVMSGMPYWQVKNSWGPTWGNEGYIKIERGVAGSGRCAIAKHPSYPI